MIYSNVIRVLDISYIIRIHNCQGFQSHSLCNQGSLVLGFSVT